MNEIEETRAEAQEIIWNATADLRRGAIEFWQWEQICKLAYMDGYLAGVEVAQ